MAEDRKGLAIASEEEKRELRAFSLTERCASEPAPEDPFALARAVRRTPDTSESLWEERRQIRDVLADWWRRWTAFQTAQGFKGDPGIGLMPIDEWARETPEQTAARIRRAKYGPDDTEITPEMVEAGAAALVAVDSSYRRWPEEDREVVREIYRAMEIARLGAEETQSRSS